MGPLPCCTIVSVEIRLSQTAHRLLDLNLLLCVNVDYLFIHILAVDVPHIGCSIQGLAYNLSLILWLQYQYLSHNLPLNTINPF